MTVHQPAFVQSAVVSRNLYPLIIPYHADGFSCKDVFHGKSVSAGVRDAGVREGKQHFLLLLKQIVVGKDKLVM